MKASLSFPNSEPQKSFNIKTQEIPYVGVETSKTAMPKISGYAMYYASTDAKPPVGLKAVHRFSSRTCEISNLTLLLLISHLKGARDTSVGEGGEAVNEEQISW